MMIESQPPTEEEAQPIHRQRIPTTTLRRLEARAVRLAPDASQPPTGEVAPLIRHQRIPTTIQLPPVVKEERPVRAGL